MNLFWLYGGRMLYRRTARLYNQPHLIKIILEATQMLSTALTLLGEGERAPYRPTHRRHPCTVWCARRRSNFVRCCRLALALCAEYRRRCPGKVHKCEALLRRMRRSPPSTPSTPPEYATPPRMGWVGRRFQVPLAMDAEFYHDNACEAYRRWVLHKLRTNPHFGRDRRMPRLRRRLEALCLQR